MRAVGISLSGIRTGSARLLASAANLASGDTASSAPSVPTTANLPVVWQPEQTRVEVHTRLVGAPHAWRLIPDPSSRYTDIAGMIVTHPIDMADELTEQIAAKVAVGAGISVLRTVERIEGHFVDRWA